MKTRILTAVAGIPVVLLLLFWPGGGPWSAGVAVVCGVAIWEYAAGLAGRDIWVHWIALAVYAAAILSSAAGIVGGGSALDAIVAFLLSWNPARGEVGPGLAFAALMAGDLLWARRAPIRNVGATVLGIAYIPALLSFLILLRTLRAPDGRDVGAWAVLCVLLVIWAGDSAAYFVGRAWGRRKAAPAISPNKTWEGVFGGLAASAVAGGLVVPPLLGGSALAIGAGLAFGALVGAAGQVGDLVESAMKREAGLKDFGALLPGHGGVLDRFDSLLFAAPAAYLLLRAFL